MFLIFRAIGNLIRNPAFTVAAGTPLLLGWFGFEISLTLMESAAVTELSELWMVFATLLSGAFLVAASIVAAIGGHRTYIADEPLPVRVALLHDLPLKTYFPRTLLVTMIAFVPGAITAAIVVAWLDSPTASLEGIDEVYSSTYGVTLVHDHLAGWVISVMSIAIGISLPSIANGRSEPFWASVRAGVRRLPAVALAVTVLFVPASVGYFLIDSRIADVMASFYPGIPAVFLSALIGTIFALIEISILSEVYRTVRPSLTEDDPNGPVSAAVFE